MSVDQQATDDGRATARGCRHEPTVQCGTCQSWHSLADLADDPSCHCQADLSEQYERAMRTGGGR